jgi:riboflavin biosynthesis pyrimidine reductase
MQIHESFFHEHLVNRVHVYLAPAIIGALPKKQFLKNVCYQELEGDHYFSADYNRGEEHV